MQGHKKYCLNVSSYKYKRECMKLFQSNINKSLSSPNNDISFESENLCPGGKHCKNYGIILSLEQKIKTLNDTVNQLTKINEYSESNHNRNNNTPTKNLEPKRHDSFNEFCNSFRNSVKKKKLQENKRNIFGNITLPPQISEPYKIRPYNSISNESKIPFKKIPNKNHINLELNNLKNYKSKLYLKTENNEDINDQFFFNKKEINSKNNNNIEEDKYENNKKEEEKNTIQKLYTSITQAFHEEEKTPIDNREVNNNNIKKNDVIIDYDEKNSSKKNNKKNEEEIQKKNEHKENINIKNNKKNIDEQNKNNNNINTNTNTNNNKKETKKNINNNLSLPFIKKIKTYKLIESLKQNKTQNQRYEYEFIDNKNYIKDENKLYFRKFKGKIRNSFNSFNASKNKLLSRSFGLHNNTEGNHSLFNLGTKNIKTLSNQNRFSKIKTNSFNNFKPLSLTQKPFKIKRNINQDDFNINNKFNSEIKIKNNKYNLILSPNNSYEFKDFIKNFEFKKEDVNNEKNKIFNDIYNLSSYKDDLLIEKLKSLSKEAIDKYRSFIKNFLKYLKDSRDLLHKFKIFHNLMNNSKNKTGNNNKSNNKNKLLINEEFKKYREDVIKLLNCEDVHIFIYDSILDCLILKGEKEEIKFPKNKELIGLSFTSAKIVRYEADNNSSIISPSILSEENLLNKINNLLIYPLKDKNDNIYGIIEAVNKKQEQSIKEYDTGYFKEKTSFNKIDEIMMSLISKDLGNFCKYYNYIIYNKNYLLYYHSLCTFFKKLFIKKEIKEDNNLFYMINEIIELSKIIFEMKDIQFILCKNDQFYNLQKIQNVPLEGLIYKCYKDKAIIYTCNPLVNNYYSNKSDIIINIYNMDKNVNILTVPIIELNTNNVIMIIQIKTNKNLGIDYINNNISVSVDKEKLSDENLFIIENISFIIQKYLLDNIELFQKY